MPYTTDEIASAIAPDGAWELLPQSQTQATGTRLGDYASAIRAQLLLGDAAHPTVAVYVADITSESAPTAVPATLVMFDNIGIDFSKFATSEGQSDVLALFDQYGERCSDGGGMNVAFANIKNSTPTATRAVDSAAINGPSSGWSSANNGTWTVRVVASSASLSVADIGASSETAPAGAIVGSFEVSIPSVSEAAAPMCTVSGLFLCLRRLGRRAA